MFFLFYKKNVSRSKFTLMPAFLNEIPSQALIHDHKIRGRRGASLNTYESGQLAAG